MLLEEKDLKGAPSDVETLGHYVGGKRVDGTSGRFGNVYNPALGSLKARVPYATTEEVNRAVAAARAAFPAWANTSPLRRSRIMFKFKELLDANIEKLGAIITSEHGKVRDDAMGEVTR